MRQSNAIRQELTPLADAPSTCSPAKQGELNASIASFSRTIDDYNRLAKQEIVTDKQEKALGRVKNFRVELSDYRELLDRVKREREEALSSQNRAELLGRRPHHATSPENPYANVAHASPFRPSDASSFGASPADATREQHALREQSFMSQSNAQLDEFLERGRNVLSDLGQQREMLKGTQKRLFDAANTLGISGDTIRMVERRAKQDKFIFGGGVVIFFLFCYLVLKLFRG